jgi:hypothetical protein
MQLSLSLLVLFLLPSYLNGQAQGHSLQLEANLISQKFCVENDAYIYRLNLELIYTNVGAQSLILDKGSNLISYVRVARNEADFTQKKFEVDMSISWYAAGGSLADAGNEPDERFKVLKPGKSFKTYGKTSIIRTEAPLAAGEHVLQVIIPTWNDTEKAYEKLKARWRKTGELWAKTAFSIPVKLLIKENQKGTKC